MNKRINEIWESAGGSYTRGNQHEWPAAKIDNPEKFAELLIQEVCDLIETRDPRVEPAAHIYIKKVFGL
jgi:hypothetical protein